MIRRCFEVLADGRPIALFLADLAVTPLERAIGFSGRTAVLADEAILFVFDSETRTPFTMRDTLVSLDLAFADADGRFIETRSITWLDPAPIVPRAPYRYALEMPAGGFWRYGIAVGRSIRAAVPAETFTAGRVFR